MEFEKMYEEEDLFPREFASWEKREYGFLFFNEKNKDSYDSNHAVIFRKNVADLKLVLKDIVGFYTKKGIRPSIYQSMLDEGYFQEKKEEFLDSGFTCWTELQKYMVLSEKSSIVPNPKVLVRRVVCWDEEYGSEIFEKAGEPWEIAVAKRVLANRNTIFYVAFYLGKPVGMVYGHITGNVCRGDYLLVSKECRNIGVGRALMDAFAKGCSREEGLLCYLWPDGETAEKIHREAGFCHVETKQAGRAAYRG